MSAFNTVTVTWPPGRDGEAVVVQFTYGDVWQNHYVVGETIRWGGNDIGVPHRHVVVEGLTERPTVGVPQEFDIHIRDGVIERVEPTSGAYDFVSPDEPYVVVEP